MDSRYSNLFGNQILNKYVDWEFNFSEKTNTVSRNWRNKTTEKFIFWAWLFAQTVWIWVVLTNIYNFKNLIRTIDVALELAEIKNSVPIIPLDDTYIGLLMSKTKHQSGMAHDEGICFGLSDLWSQGGAFWNKIVKC